MADYLPHSCFSATCMTYCQRSNDDSKTGWFPDLWNDWIRQFDSFHLSHSDTIRPNAKHPTDFWMVVSLVTLSSWFSIIVTNSEWNMHIIILIFHRFDIIVWRINTWSYFEKSVVTIWESCEFLRFAVAILSNNSYTTKV